MPNPRGFIGVCLMLLLTSFAPVHAAGLSDPLNVLPSAGAASMQAFTLTVSNPQSAGVVNLRLTPNCHAEYSVVANQFRLLNDNLSTWSNPFAPGGGGIANNSQCTLSATGASAILSGGYLIVTFPLQFKPEFRGVHNIEASVVDINGGASDWRYLGTFTVLGSQPPPTAILPFIGSDFGTITWENTTPQTYRIGATSLHRAGHQYRYLTYVLLLPLPNTSSFTAAGTCLIEYNKLSNGVRLINDSGTGWLGGLEGVAITPAAPMLQNNVCTVDVSRTEVALNGAPNVPNVVFWVQPKPTLSGLIGLFQQAQDVYGRWTDFRQGGTFTFFDSPARPGPGVVPVEQSQSGVINGSGTVRAIARHSGGVNQLGQVHVRLSRQIMPVNYDPSAPPSPICHVVYIRTSDTLGLVNDEGTGLVSPGAVLRGTNISLSNQRCSVNVATASTTLSGDTLTLDLPMTFVQANPFNDEVKVWVNTFDISGATLSHWVQSGVWNISPSCTGQGCTQ